MKVNHIKCVNIWEISIDEEVNFDSLFMWNLIHQWLKVPYVNLTCFDLCEHKCMHNATIFNCAKTSSNYSLVGLFNIIVVCKAWKKESRSLVLGWISSRSRNEDGIHKIIMIYLFTTYFFLVYLHSFDKNAINYLDSGSHRSREGWMNKSVEYIVTFKLISVIHSCVGQS